MDTDTECTICCGVTWKATMQQVMLLRCRYSGQACEVLGVFGEGLDALVRQKAEGFGSFLGCSPTEAWRQYTSAMPVVLGRLPCARCRCVGTIRRLRLGKVERQLLLLAPEPGEPPVVLVRTHRDRSQEEAERRAIRKLGAKGLVELLLYKRDTPTRVLTKDGRAVSRGFYVRCFRLAPVGSALVARTRAELANGKPIRWDKHRDAIVAEACRTTDELLAEFLSMITQDMQDALKERTYARAEHDRTLSIIYGSVHFLCGAVLDAVSGVRQRGTAERRDVEGLAG